MNKLILATLLGAYGLAAQAQDNPLWMRHPAISPDGKTIAFSYQGDIFTVPSNGGTAKQITALKVGASRHLRLHNLVRFLQ